MVNLFINDVRVSVEEHSNVFQACETLGVVVPRFCFHEKLLIAGNCRMCLVEIEKFPKPVASCAIPVIENIKVYTQTPLVKKARESIIEFLLINHPLDCPICDQGGECDLQNQSIFFGQASSRSFIKQRSILEKGAGPLIKMIITRCIHCTRCSRFFSEKAGRSLFLIIGRGNAIEIGNYSRVGLDNYLSGNIIDLCPVGWFFIKV